MKAAVLRSIKPYWVFLIIARKMGWDVPQEKTIELGKNKPSSTDWNKQTYIYCSKDKKSFKRIPEQYRPLMKPLLGKVVGEFACDNIYDFKPTKLWCYHGENIHYLNSILEYSHTCLHYDEIEDYGNGKTLYGWHISDLKIYDTPKEISEFHHFCTYPNNTCEDCAIQKLKPHCHYGEGLTRPPQSWGYVEEN